MTVSKLDTAGTDGEQDVYVAPPSFSQQRLWMMHQLDPTSPVYVLPAAFRLKGALDASSLERALDEIFRRHESLRTTFSYENGELMQIIAPSMSADLQKTDLRHLSETAREEEVLRLINHHMRLPFDLGAGPLVRSYLMKLAAEEHVLVLNLNHMVADGLSCGLMARELEKLYAAFTKGQVSPLASLAIQYADYTIWERRCMQGTRLQGQLAYWKKQLGGTLPVLELPADRPRPARHTFNGALFPLKFSLSLTNELKALGRGEKASLFMTLLTAYKILLHRYTGQTDMIVGAAAANRGREELEPMIGFFLNLLVLRTPISADMSFRACLQKVRDVTAAAYENKDVPFEKLVEELRPERDPSHHPLFQVLFAFHNAPIDLDLLDLKCETIPVDNGAAKFDLYFELWETDGCVGGRIEYNTDLFDEARIARMAGHFTTLLEGIVANPGKPISELPLLTESESVQILKKWNATQRDFPQTKRIHELFEAQVERSPEAVALVYGHERLSYAELNSRADELAQRLRALGVAWETLVGVCLKRSPVLMTTLLAILKAGGAYLPLDPAYPMERLQFILEDARSPLLVTQQELTNLLAPPGTRVLCLDDEGREVPPPAQLEIEATPRTMTGDTGTPSIRDMAYVLYTSGSTGKPKGVAIEHRNVVNLIYWARELFTPEELAGVLASTSICFDLSVFEFFVPLSYGGKIILAENALQLPQLPAAGEVTLVNTVPSAIAELVRQNGLGESVRTVTLCGEALSSQLADQIYQSQPSISRVYDLYGPTEDTVYSTVALRQPGTPATIGRPMSNKQVYILSEQRQPVPIGIPGEIYIGGSGLARGYLHQTALTAEKFVHDPFSSDPSARLYRTGDLARYFPDGNIEFLGRTDHQIKLRGFRIELGEIESVLREHDAVSEAVVTLQGETSKDKQLVAYLTFKSGQTANENELRKFAKTSLPDYMIPAAFLVLESFPQTPNGKIDRKVLARTNAGRLAINEEFVTPLTPVQKELAGIWKEILEVQQVGINDNFFYLGGHSILAMRVSARMCEVFNIDISMMTIFERPTIAELAESLEEQLLSGQAA